MLDKGYEIVVMDNLSNSKFESVKRIEQLTNKTFKFYKVDMLDFNGMCKIFDENKIDSVIHFAGLKAVGESVQKPLEYYNNNIVGTVNLLRVMDRYNCKNMIFPHQLQFMVWIILLHIPRI